MNLSVIARSREPWTAFTIASILESAGLHPVVFENHLVQMNWFLSGAVGGVRILVPEEELKTAREILDNPIFTVSETRTNTFIPPGRLVTTIIATAVTQSLHAFGLIALIWRRYRKVAIH
jgi:hypothetical protein